MSQYVEALYREANGYIARGQWQKLAAVNAELAAQHAPIVAVGPDHDPARAKRAAAKLRKAAG
jgi:hypothetical protein